MPFEDRGGFPTYWQRFGAGARTALMIHCSLAHSGVWGPMAKHLANDLSMIAFDMPGHGRSTPWEGPGDYQGLTARIAADFCREGPRDVIGHSFGATVALRLAIEHPELVRSLTLIEPVWFGLVLDMDSDLRAAHEAESQPFIEAWEAGDRAAAARAFTEHWGGGFPWEMLPEAQRVLMASQIHLVVEGGRAIYEDPGGMGLPGVLEQVGCPVLLVEGANSPAIIAAIQTELARRLPDVQREVITGAGHMVPITHAKDVASIVAKWCLGRRHSTPE